MTWGRQDPELTRRLLRAKDRMTARPEEAWPVRRLAKVSGVSEAHFSRSFKRAFGVPPHRYLLTLRLERAKALLRDTDRRSFARRWLRNLREIPTGVLGLITRLRFTS